MSFLIGVYTICLDLSVQNSKIFCIILNDKSLKMDISFVTNLTKWCNQSDWPVHRLILARQFTVCMVICCPVSTYPRLCSSDWLDAHPNLIHRWAQLTDSHIASAFIVLCHLCKLGQCIPYFWHFKAPVWPWKLGQGHQNIINSSPSPNYVSMQDWLKSIHWFRR